MSQTPPQQGPDVQVLVAGPDFSKEYAELAQECAAVNAADGPRDRCTMRNRFRLHGTMVNVISEGRAWQSSNGRVRVVLLGTPEHLQTVTDRIIELQSEIATASLIEPSTPAAAEHKSRLLERLRRENEQRTNELIFLRTNIKRANEADAGAFDNGAAPSETNDEDSETVSQTDRGKADLSPSNTADSTEFSSSSAKLEEEGEAIHVTAETFGKMLKIRKFEIKHKERLFRRPKVRQFFFEGVLYRSGEELKTTWAELFMDLIYVSVIAKTGHQVAPPPTWAGVNKFALLIFPVLQHWYNVMFYNNHFFHEDLYHKILMFISMGGIVLMGNSAASAFDPDPAINTSAIFIYAYVISRVVLMISRVVIMFYFEKRFKHSSELQTFLALFSLFPFIAILALPVNGTKERENLRYGLWWLGNIIEFLLIGLIVAASRLLQPKYFIAVNIEHLTERNGLLFVITLGEIVNAFLYDSRSSTISMASLLTLLALLMAVCLNGLYFRSEGSEHFRHALRRHWTTGASWNALHFPLYVATITLGAATMALITINVNANKLLDAASHLSLAAAADPAKTTPEPAAASPEPPSLTQVEASAISFEFRSIFATAYAVIFFCLGIMGMMHEHEPPENESSKTDEKGRRKHKVPMPNISLKARIAIKFITGDIMLVCGLSISSWPPEAWLGFAASLSVLALVIEEWGRLHMKRRKTE
ncbi:hypothetical protein HK105_203045 [Polyrhizophydium stewartii]|uniref:Bacterial low temperature requirement A protein-domain-containing protein n=1 Tax=Polyrhizophydium stewartii TaxID=2732419 RepID=A0ABR4ND03_9FUNG|nr:hypothetical protein HK105_007901 [Polyrhizophydium stewartii]